MTILKVEKLTKSFGGIVAVDDVSFNVNKGEIFGIIGPNGSGKTTTINLISGFLKPDAGDIYFKNIRINNLKPYERVRMGLARTFQLVRLFKRLTLLENLLVPYSHIKLEERLEKAINMLEFFGLIDLKDELVCNLSFGQQRLIELARVLMLDPELILLDEPTGGVNPVLIDKIVEYIHKLRKEEGKTFVIIEHNLSVVNRLCDRVMVLDHGEKIAEGKLSSIRHNERVIKAYLGGVI